MTENTRFESLGDRMKHYEGLEASRKLMPGLPIMVRLDGRSFHTFTRGMTRPYHLPMSQAMIETARFLVEDTHARFAYTQSDEISLGYWYPDATSQMLFDGRIQKLTSILAALATAKFNQEVVRTMPEKAAMLPVFDARVFNLPSLEEMANCVLFRALDCAKNSITMAASAYYSHAQLFGVSGRDKHELLRAKGVNWADYPDYFKNGSLLRRETVLKELTGEELSRIPEGRRPAGPVPRSQVVVVETPPFARVANPVDVLFHGAAPQHRKEPDTAEAVPG